jgi:hypothetical protein
VALSRLPKPVSMRINAALQMPGPAINEALCMINLLDRRSSLKRNFALGLVQFVTQQCPVPVVIDVFVNYPLNLTVIVNPCLLRGDPYSLLAYYVRAGRKQGPWPPLSYHGVKENLRS